MSGGARQRRLPSVQDAVAFDPPGRGHWRREVAHFPRGQTPLYRRLPKRGFTNPFKVTAQPVNLRKLKKLAGQDVTPETLFAAGLISKQDVPAKLLAAGDADRAYTVRGVQVSASAKTKIEAAGGRVEA